MAKPDRSLRGLHVATRARKLREHLGLPIPGERDERRFAQIRLTPATQNQVDDLVFATQYNYDYGTISDLRLCRRGVTAVIEERTLPLLDDLGLRYRRLPLE